MDAKSRIQTLRLIDRINTHPEQAQSLGLTDKSTFHGEPLPPADSKSAPPQESYDATGKC